MKTLRMTFARADGKRVNINLKHAKDSQSEATVRTAMQEIIDTQAIVPAVTSIVSAQLIDRTVTDVIA